MMSIALSDFYYLSPILIIGLAIVILLFLLLLLRVGTKVCAIFSVISLCAALAATVILGYQIITFPKTVEVQQQNYQINLFNDADQITHPGSLIPAPTPALTAPVADDTETVISDELPVATTEESVIDSTETNDPENIQINQNIVNSGNVSEEVGTNLLDATDDTVAQTTQDSVTTSDVELVSAHIWKASYVTILFTCDGYGLLYTGLILIICIIVAALAFQWFKADSDDQGLFYLILLFASLGGIILVYASHLISLFIGIELISIPLVGLIGFQYSQSNAIEAAIKYMILSAVATMFLLLGIAFYYAATGELTFSGLSYQLSILAHPDLLLLTGVCLMLVGVGFKLSLVPFQLWLPDVFQGAPTAVSLLLATMAKMAIFCAVARLFLLAPIVNHEAMRLILILMAFCSIIWGNFFALMQTNTKRLLAYSSIANFGYLFIALIAVQYQVLALETIGIYLVSYVLANICVFGVISLESSSSHRHDREQDTDLKGLFWRRPVMALSIAVGLLSLAGIPLTIGFMSRFALIILSVTAEFWWLATAIVIGSAFGLYFYLRLVINLYLKPDATDTPEPGMEHNVVLRLKNIGFSETIIVLSALLILFCGIYPQPLFTLVSAAHYLVP
ncbi:NADH-quinone oxidoreductase subunit N [Zophobihabitans entericus]|uniref:NADH-quinone oxidoreductase subunit N n=1 Tax=Zophobihabitans entericus TaxID=1635327 RepID=A0A6G9I825_9GAMM|nr:NADH-quinone oxidoreductase subunit N [Zophobihabitans entericus]QIQ20368.1 NADH-quinone oxidoreductase subunit N [Zophobihabitans entericus]